jgi:hypothetical protein
MVGDRVAADVLDRFVLLRTFPLATCAWCTTIEDGRGGAVLVVGTQTGELHRLVWDAHPVLRRVPVPADLGRNLRLNPTALPNRVVAVGYGEGLEGKLAVVDLASETVVDRRDLVSPCGFLAADVDGDAVDEHILHYGVAARGIEILDSRGEELLLGDLDELNGANSDVSAVLSMPDPETGRTLLVVGLGPWNQAGLGFGLFVYRWRSAGGFERLARRRLGEVQALTLADLDGDGRRELHASLAHRPTRDQSLIYGDFLPQGIYRIDMRSLDAEPAGESHPHPAFFGPADGLVPILPRWSSYGIGSVRLGNGRDALAATLGVDMKDGSSAGYLTVVVETPEGPRRVTVPSEHLPVRYVTSGDLVPEAPGDEIAATTGSHVLVFGRSREEARAPVTGQVRVRLTDDLRTGACPPPGWSFRDRRSYSERETGGVRFVCSHGRGDRLLRDVDLTGGPVRFGARVTLRRATWAAKLNVGLFSKARTSGHVDSLIAVAFARSSYDPRGMILHVRLDGEQALLQGLERAGSYDLEWGMPLDIEVEYAPDPPGLPCESGTPRAASFVTT